MQVLPGEGSPNETINWNNWHKDKRIFTKKKKWEKGKHEWKNELLYVILTWTVLHLLSLLFCLVVHFVMFAKAFPTTMSTDYLNRTAVRNTKCLWDLMFGSVTWCQVLFLFSWHLKVSSVHLSNLNLQQLWMLLELNVSVKHWQEPLQLKNLEMTHRSYHCLSYRALYDVTDNCLSV